MSPYTEKNISMLQYTVGYYYNLLAAPVDLPFQFWLIHLLDHISRSWMVYLHEKIHMHANISDQSNGVEA